MPRQLAPRSGATLMINPQHFGQATALWPSERNVHLQLIYFFFSFSVFGCLRKVNKVPGKSPTKRVRQEEEPLAISAAKLLSCNWFAVNRLTRPHVAHTHTHEYASCTSTLKFNVCPIALKYATQLLLNTCSGNKQQVGAARGRGSVSRRRRKQNKELFSTKLA